MQERRTKIKQKRRLTYIAITTVRSLGRGHAKRREGKPVCLDAVCVSLRRLVDNDRVAQTLQTGRIFTEPKHQTGDDLYRFNSSTEIVFLPSNAHTINVIWTYNGYNIHFKDVLK